MRVDRRQTHSQGEAWTLRRVVQTAGVALLALTNPAAAVVTSRNTRLYGLKHQEHRDLARDANRDFFQADKQETHVVSKSMEMLWLPFESPQPPPRVRVPHTDIAAQDDWMNFERRGDAPSPPTADQRAVSQNNTVEDKTSTPPPLPPRNSSLLLQPAPVLQCVNESMLQPCPPTIDPDPAWQSYLAMCVIVRDEPFDLPEWINHYRGLGADAFYIFDHNSSVPLYTALQPIASDNHISYRYFNHFPSNSSTQVAVYNTCIRNYGDKHQFIGFFDSDEYIIQKKGAKPFVDFLRQHEDVGALAVNWRQFGSSGHIQRPVGRVVDNYLFCYAADDPNNKHVKLIGNTQYIDRMETPHSALYTYEKFAVSENMERVDGPFSETISFQKYVLYHYVTRSLEDFKRKMARGSANLNIAKTMTFFNGVNKQATAFCLEARTKAADDA